MINVSGISSETRDAWEPYIEYEFGAVFNSWLQINQACWLYFKLKSLDDDPAVFPKGKWASLQSFLSLIDAHFAG